MRRAPRPASPPPYGAARCAAWGPRKSGGPAWAPPPRGFPAITAWYMAGVKRSGEYVVWPRMSLHSFSISSWSASRQARSCGESTSTPSTSKTAPRKPMRPPLLLHLTWIGGSARDSGRDARAEPTQALAGRAQKRDLGAHDHVDRHLLQHRAEASRPDEGAQECIRGQLLAQRLRDAAGEVETAGREHLQGQIGGLGAQDVQEEVHRRDGKRVLPPEPGLHDR